MKIETASTYENLKNGYSKLTIKTNNPFMKELLVKLFIAFSDNENEDLKTF